MFYRERERERGGGDRERERERERLFSLQSERSEAVMLVSLLSHIRISYLLNLELL